MKELFDEMPMIGKLAMIASGGLVIYGAFRLAKWVLKRRELPF